MKGGEEDAIVYEMKTVNGDGKERGTAESTGELHENEIKAIFSLANAINVFLSLFHLLVLFFSRFFFVIWRNKNSLDAFCLLE